MQTDIAHHRLFNQHIAGEKFQQPEEVVRWMGALQAQDYQQAVWAIGVSADRLYSIYTSRRSLLLSKDGF